MNDICLNYATEDREKAAKLAALFAEKGWKVLSNEPPEVPSTLETRTARQNVINSTVVVVLWSAAARESAFLRVTLGHVNHLNTLVALLEKIEHPPEAISPTVVDLSEWDGSELTTQPPPPRTDTGPRKVIRPGTPGRAPRPPEPAWRLELKDLVSFIRFIMRESEEASAAPPQNESAGPAHTAAPPAQLKNAGGPGSGGLFISYRRNEAAAYARALYDRLAARFGKEKVFLDVENVGWGDDFVEAITAAAESCAVMIVLVSRGWARGTGGQEEEDDYVRLEVATALGRKIRVIPILIQGAAMPTQEEMPKDLLLLLRRNALALSDTRWERDVEDLIKNLEATLKD